MLNSIEKAMGTSNRRWHSSKTNKETSKNIFSILQLRLHPSIIALRKKILNGPKDKIYEVDLTYLTSRGAWYYTSWKGDVSKSGGIATNIGIHFFDMLTWIFGDVKENTVHLHSHDRACGYLQLEKARVRWFLSINADTLPKELNSSGQRTIRSIKIEGEELEFSEGFGDLHTQSYKAILANEGFRIGETKKSIKIVHDIRYANPVGLTGDYHPLAKIPQSKHPFY
jgi:UDP-N-acetyl-2-amino-2-deoxyglucuronate dehydrogenase